MRRKYEKAIAKLNKISLIKIVVTLLLIIISIKFDKIPALIPIILIFLWIFFNIEFFMTRANYKEIYEYITGIKTFNYKPVTIKQEELVELIKQGIHANTYISYNEQIHTIETKNNKYFFLDYDEYKSLEALLKARIANIRISEIEEYELLAFNGEDPKNYIKK